MAAIIEQNKHLPRILCLHGSGTSAEIFQIQTRGIRAALRNHFRFVFVNAPYRSAPGPGVLPFFEGMSYFSWIKPAEDSDSSGEEDDDFANYDQTMYKRLKDALTNDDGAPFVGVLGFSQGARLAAGLLQRQQQLRDRQMPKLQFAMLFSGTYPPVNVGQPESGEDVSIRIPSIHVYGLEDPFVTQSRKLGDRCFEKSKRTIAQHAGGHYLPSSIKSNKRLAELVLRAAERSDSKPEYSCWLAQG